MGRLSHICYRPCVAVLKSILPFWALLLTVKLDTDFTIFVHELFVPLERRDASVPAS